MNPFLTSPFALGPVSSLQEMLRTIAYVDRSVPFLRPTGQFDEATLEAVMTCQKCHGLPVTGVVDRQTWNAVASAFLQAWGTISPPATLTYFPPETPNVQPGQSSPLLPLVQEIFRGLAQTLADVDPAPSTGILDEATQANLRWVQRRASLPATGRLDRKTWNMLLRLFDTFSSGTIPTVVQAGVET